MQSENGGRETEKKREMLGPPFAAPPFGAPLLGPHLFGSHFFHRPVSSVEAISMDDFQVEGAMLFEKIPLIDDVQVGWWLRTVLPEHTEECAMGHENVVQCLSTFCRWRSWRPIRTMWFRCLLTPVAVRRSTTPIGAVGQIVKR